ncbi:MAG: hypothetical protein WDZ83_17495 [Rhizobiaceae bacterium]
MPRALFLAPLIFAAVPSAAHAQESERYRLERTEDGFVRMDMETGGMSLCHERNGELVCRDATDNESAVGAGANALSERIDALERRIAALEGLPPGEGANALPSEEEFEQTMSLMERFLRRFMGIVKDLDGDMKQEGEPAPDRT